MAGQRLISGDESDLDADAVAVIDGYLMELAGTLPSRAPLDDDVLTELRDDLLEATTSLLPATRSPVAAARAAIADFGEAATVGAAFQPELTMRRARRLGLALFASGPVVGACWLTAGFLADPPAVAAWRWLPLLVAPLLIIGAPATVLTVATTGRLTRWVSPPSSVCATAATMALGAAAGGDLLLLLGSSILLLSAVPAPLPLLALPVLASLLRLAFVTRIARGLLSRRRPPPLAV